MQIGDWGNVLIRHVHEWKHRKHSPWACLFSGVEFHGAFHFQKIIFSCSRFGAHIVSTVILTNYEHTHKATTRQCFKRILLTVKNLTPICAPFGTKAQCHQVSQSAAVSHGAKDASWICIDSYWLNGPMSACRHVCCKCNWSKWQIPTSSCLLLLCRPSYYLKHYCWFSCWWFLVLYT